MQVVTPDTTETFLERAHSLLCADEARNNLALGITSTIIGQPGLYPVVQHWLVEDDGVVVAAALRTPPFNLVLPHPLDEGALLLLAAGIDDDLPGVSGAVPEASLFAEAWCARTSHRQHAVTAQGIYALERVVPVTGVAGAMRAATVDDRDLVREWFADFAAEVLPSRGRPADAEAEALRERSVDARLTDGRHSGVSLWEHDGEIVSLAAFGGQTPHGVRIGPVFTPADRRGHGYASALTAALTAQLLAGGRRFCFLYTDLANPTSNKIYRAIGYEHVCDAVEIEFE